MSNATNSASGVTAYCQQPDNCLLLAPFLLQLHLSDGDLNVNGVDIERWSY